MKYLNIKTSVPEIYFKLPGLNFNNEVIFSDNVPELAISRIVKTFNRNGIDVNIHRLADKIILIKYKDVKFNTYLIR
jgi:hypothetical protein